MGTRSIQQMQNRARAIRGGGYPQTKQRSLSELPVGGSGGLRWGVVITAEAGDTFVTVKEVVRSDSGYTLSGTAEPIWCQPGMTGADYSTFAVGEDHAEWSDYWVVFPILRGDDGEYYAAYLLPLAVAPWPSDSTYDVLDCWPVPAYGA